MRVLLVHNRYRFPGGEERHVDLLEGLLPSFGLDVRRFEVDSGAIPTSLAARARIAFGLAYRNSGGRLVAEAMQPFAPDVVHFHNIMPILTPAALRAAKRAGAAVVLTIPNFRFACPSGTLMRNGHPHDDCLRGSSLLCGVRGSRRPWSESVAYGLGIEIQRRLGLLHRWVDAFVVPSEFLAERAVWAGLPANRLHVIRNGIFPAAVTSSLGASALYVGRLSEEKGAGVLIEASRQFGLDVVIAGDGPLRPLVERAPAHVRYVGQVGPRELDTLRADARCAVVPSVGPDVLPFAAIEALAAGLPVVAARVGGLPEIVDDGITGFLVPPGDPEALARAVGEILRDDDLAAAFGSAAQRAASSRFDAATQTGRLVDLYRSVA